MLDQGGCGYNNLEYVPSKLLTPTAPSLKGVRLGTKPGYPQLQWPRGCYTLVTMSVQLIYEDHDPVEVILSQVTPHSVATLFDVSTILN